MIAARHHFNGVLAATVSPTGRAFPYKLTAEQMRDFPDGQIRNHPDSELDLCCISFPQIQESAWKDGKDLFTRFLTPELIPSKDTLELMPIIQEVYMYGYPIGLWDTGHQLPIVRRGSLASHPALDYGGKPKVAVDIAAFPGSSGSPIFIVSDGGPISDKTGNVWMNLQVACFLGVMSEGVTMKPDGQLETRAIPVQHQQVNEGMVPIHLGYFIKSIEVIRFVQAIVNNVL